MDYYAIGQRLKAHRIAASLRAEDVAECLKISRAAVYRLEKGEIVKIETLERLAELLNTSVASLLGVSTEYYSSADGFFERMKQLEEESSKVCVHFSPFSFLLTSPAYLTYLKKMIIESLPVTELNAHVYQKIQSTLSILKTRQHNLEKHFSKVFNLIGVQEIEKFLHLGVVGSFDMSASQVMKRRLEARNEVIHLVNLLENSENPPQISIINEAIPTFTFQIFHNENAPFALATSPFRLGELPNILTGIASVTSAVDAITQHQKSFDNIWNKGAKDAEAVKILKNILNRY